MKNRKKRVLLLAILVLAAVLVAVLGVIAFKLHEYQVSREYYESLRGALKIGGRLA